jgi:23S rRNA (pseudouridine1915-N3)-methyltransferase
VNLQIATIGRASKKSVPLEEAFAGYYERIRRYCASQTANFADEIKFLASLERPQLRSKSVLVLLDSRGRNFSTEEFAGWMRKQRDQGTQHFIFAVGPADGWSDAARQHADLLLSLSAMTLPHELAAVVLAEQIYRAFTIIEGHPYHLGHT